MEELHNRLGSRLEEGLGRRLRGEEGLEMTQWSPLVEVAEDEKEYVMVIPLNFRPQ